MEPPTPALQQATSVHRIAEDIMETVADRSELSTPVHDGAANFSKTASWISLLDLHQPERIGSRKIQQTTADAAPLLSIKICSSSLLNFNKSAYSQSKIALQAN